MTQKSTKKNREDQKIAKRETVVEIPGKCGRRHYDCQVCKTFLSTLFLFMFVNIKVPIREVFLRVRNICNILISNIFGGGKQLPYPVLPIIGAATGRMFVSTQFTDI